MRENVFAFHRFREYERICSCWQRFADKEDAAAEGGCNM